MIKKIFALFCAALFASFSVFADDYSPLGETSSKMIYKFSIPKEVMYDYQTYKIKQIPLDYLINPIDSISAENPVPDMNFEKPGTYVWATFENGKLNIIPVNNVPFKVFVCTTDNSDLFIKVVDLNANIIDNAIVKCNGKKVKFNSETASYFCKSQSKHYWDNAISVEYDGYLKQLKEKIFYYVNKRRYITTTEYNNFINSFITTDKPEYRPGDTVRWKAVVVDLKGKWCDEELFLSFGTYTRTNELGTVKPHRPGVYYGEFVVNDSIYNIKLNTWNTLRIYRKGKKNDITDKVSSTFLYKDYELKSLRTAVNVPEVIIVGSDVVFTAGSTGDNKKVADKIGIEVNTTDEKGNPIMSGNISAQYKLNISGTFKDNYIWYPDTLFTVNVPINTNGKTIVPINLPPLPDGSFAVSASFDIATPDYETKKESKYISIIINSEVNKKMAADDIFANYYQKQNTSDVENSDRVKSPLIETLHTVDSVGFMVKDCGIEFIYAIYKDGKKIKSSTAKSIDWRINTTKDAKYDLNLFFKNSDNNKYSRRTSTILHSSHTLDVRVEQPEVIAPGEKAKIRISVTDPKGKPVAGADVLAHAYTDKFDRKPQGIFYWRNKKNKEYRYYPDFDFENSGRKGVDIRTDFDDELLKLYKLSSSEYYKFLYPENDKFVFTTEDKDGSQIAPFVVKDGNIEPVISLEIDGIMAYIGIAENVQPYTFPVKPGKHNIIINTDRGKYYLNNIEVESGKKTWISVPYDVYDNEDKTGDIYAYKRKEKFNKNDLTTLIKAGLSLLDVKPVVGWPYFVNDKNNIIPLSVTETWNIDKQHSGIFFIPYNFKNCRYRETAYNTSFDFPFHNSTCEYMNYILPRDSVSYVDRCSSIYAKCIFNYFKVVTPNYNDTIYYEKDLNKFWLDIMDNYRKYTIIKEVNYNQANVIVVKPNDRKDINFPLNYVVEADDSVTYYNGNTNLIQLPFDKAATIYCLYKGAKYFSYNVVAKRGGKVCIKLPSDSMLLDAGAKSLAFEGAIRDIIQKRIIENRKQGNYRYTGYVNPFKSRDYDMLDYDEDIFDGLKEEVMVLGYGAKGRFYGARSGVNNSEGEPVRVRGIASLKTTPGYANMDFEEEAEDAEILYEVVSLQSDAGSDISDVVVRQDFRDVAYWVPSVTTDENGVVEIEVDYPEDLTRWVEEFVVMKGKYRGSKISYVTVQKDVAAKLSIPRFAIEGDSIRFVGQSINYTSDSTMLLERAFWLSKNKDIIAKEFFPNTVVAHSITDYMTAKIPLLPSIFTDTLSVTYTLHNSEDSDGEMRKLPILPQGMSAIDAMFAIAETGDTTILYSPDKEHGKVTLYAQTDIIDFLYKQIDEIAASDIDKCSNIRLAQVLKALILKKEFCEKNNQEFNDGIKVNKIIKKLEKNCNSGRWSWWNKGNFTSMNITKSVYEALVFASKYYHVSLLEKNNINNYKSELQRARNTNDYMALLDYAELFNIFGWKPEALAAVDDINKDTLQLNNLLRYQMIRIQCGESVSLSEFDTIRYKDMLGGEYYSFKVYPMWRIVNPHYYDFYFDIESTLLVYRAIESMPESAERNSRVVAMRRWLLQNRESRTYIGENLATEILFAITPQLLEKPASHKPASLIVRSGNNEMRVSNFPYTADLDPQYPITIIKSGDSEAYISLSQRYWQKAVTAKGEEMKIKTYFKGGNRLTLGKEATLVVELDLEADAEYLLIHTPIPAGCSYSDYQPYNFKVAHREDFAHMANFYVERLSAGSHIFEIKLLPRWSGKYYLNPATAELYYYPAFNANEEGKTVEIDK